MDAGTLGNMKTGTLSKKRRSLSTINVESYKSLEKTKAKSFHASILNMDSAGKLTKTLWGIPDRDNRVQILGLCKAKREQLYYCVPNHNAAM